MKVGDVRYQGDFKKDNEGIPYEAMSMKVTIKEIIEDKDGLSYTLATEDEQQATAREEVVKKETFETSEEAMTYAKSKHKEILEGTKKHIEGTITSLESKKTMLENRIKNLK